MKQYYKSRTTIVLVSIKDPIITGLNFMTTSAALYTMSILMNTKQYPFEINLNIPMFQSLDTRIKIPRKAEFKETNFP